LRVKSTYSNLQSEQLEMPLSTARLETITFGDGDYDLQTEMKIDLRQVKKKFKIFKSLNVL
jgi:hypothetical protein